MAFEIDDAKSFDENVAAYEDALIAIDVTLGAALKAHLKDFALGNVVTSDIWDALLAADEKAEAANLAAKAGAGK